MDTTKAITHVSLCAGYGGIDIGLSRAIPSLRTVAFSDIEALACANLVAKMEEGLLDAAPIWTNLKTFPWAEFRGRVDILSGGYPCQPFSSAGKRLGTEDPRHLWPYIADGIRAMRPRLCFFENVEGHISLGLREVVSELEGIGYKVAWGIFSAREVGAPHQRKRVFILAHSADQRPEWGSIIGSPSASEAVERCGAWSWPSRPGQPQHGWEPPRVVADTNGSGSRQDWEPIELRSTRTEQSPSDPWGSAEGEVRQGNAWPSRPGQPQYGWEPPRVVGNATQLQRNGSDHHARDKQQSEEVFKSGDSSWEAMGNAESANGRSITGDHRGQQGSLGEQEQVQLGGGDCGALRESNGQTQPSMGGDSDGTTSGMDYAELFVTTDNRTDELRLLGNGVVPATAERAFRTLLAELIP